MSQVKPLRDLLQNVLLAQIINIEKHPNADRLNIVTVNLGKPNSNTLALDNIEVNANDEIIKKVITGASNIKLGDFVPFLYQNNLIPGYVIYNGEHIYLRPKMLRGLLSDSMLLSEYELGIGQDHSGIYIIQGAKKTLLGKSILNVVSII